MASDPLNTFFKSIKCNHSFFPNGTSSVVSVRQDSRIPEAFEKLIKNRILSVPVVDANGLAVSVFSMLDLVNHFVHEFNENELKGLNSKKTSDFFFHYTELKEKKLEMLTERVSQVLNKEMREIETLDPVQMVPEDSDLLEAIRMLISTRAHRIVVHNRDDRRLVGLITQSRMLEFLGTVVNLVNEVEKTVSELNLGIKEVVTVEENQMAIRAFKLMREKKVSALAVVNSQGELVGNISANDLKLVGYDLSYFSYLSRPIREYLEWVSDIEFQQSPKSSIRSQVLLQQSGAGNTELKTVVCGRDNTLSFVIKTLNFYRIHRLYVIDEARRPIGVISIHDVLEKIFKSRF